MKTPYPVPTATQYVEALKVISFSGPLGEAQRKMLMFHYQAHNRTVTYKELAEAAGYDSYGVANLHYGKLAAALGEQLKMPFVPLSESDPDTPFFSSAIGTSKKYEGTEYMLIMHHELAKAIEALGWVN